MAVTVEREAEIAALVALIDRRAGLMTSGEAHRLRTVSGGSILGVLVALVAFGLCALSVEDD